MALIRDHAHVEALRLKATELFSPRTPIATQELFAGRYDQIQKLQNTIAQRGAHAIVYGERGVGKTSLANVAPIAYCVHHDAPMESVVPARINCDGTDSFDALWRKVFQSIELSSSHAPIGFLQTAEHETMSLLEWLGDTDEFTPGKVQRVLKSFGDDFQFIVTLDEFDRLPNGEVPRLMADTIKSLSDNQVRATIVVVGVGDSVPALVQGHESVGRHLIEVPLPRMDRNEVERIVTDRLKLLDEMEIESSALKTISLVCTGLPYFTHLLGQNAVYNALNGWNDRILDADVTTAMGRAIEDSEREMKQAYYAATQSRQPGSRFRYTLAACALTQRDDFGYFTAASVRDALKVITGATRGIATFLDHLNRFCERDKGRILDAIGGKHQRRFRFRDPLMQPFVIIRSLSESVITEDHIRMSLR